MRVAIKDANIFIDLEMADLFDLFFQLELEIHTSSFIVEELGVGEHRRALSYVRGGLITVHEFAFTEVAKIRQLMSEVKQAAKFNDCSVLYLAEKLEAPLLTGDGALRQSAQKRGIKVMGTLWIFDQLIATDLLHPEVASTKLQHLLDAGRFLPLVEC